MLDPAWTPAAGYAHAAGLLAILQRKEEKVKEWCERLGVVSLGLSSSLRCLRFALDNTGLAEPPAVWLGRAEASLLHAQAELAYLDTHRTIIYRRP